MVEAVTKSKITLFMDKHNALDKSCQGFSQGKSCLTNLVTVLWGFSKHVANGDAEYIIYLHFKIAF